jgi:hypothetical protein
LGELDELDDYGEAAAVPAPRGDDCSQPVSREGRLDPDFVVLGGEP